MPDSVDPRPGVSLTRLFDTYHIYFLAISEAIGDSRLHPWREPTPNGTSEWLFDPDELHAAFPATFPAAGVLCPS